MTERVRGLTIRHTVPGAKDKDDAMRLFWASFEAANGNRRIPPRQMIDVKRCACVHGLWNVYYTVPARVVRDILMDKERERNGGYA